MANLKIEMFHQNRIDLNKEIPNHPELVEFLQNHPVDAYEVRMAEIARYVEVVLHGDYYPADFDHLSGVLCEKLIAKRTGLVFPRDPALVAIVDDSDEPKIIH